MMTKIANDRDEFTQVHQLNYRTFAEEITQHQSNDEQFLVDKFNWKNKYIIAKGQDPVFDMITYHCERLFSVDLKVEIKYVYQPKGQGNG